jgi:hypothetical protein
MAAVGGCYGRPVDSDPTPWLVEGMVKSQRMVYEVAVLAST